MDFIRNVNPVDLGQRLAAARRRAGFSQENVAERLGVSRPTLVAIEKGERPARDAEVAILAELYSQPIHELFNRPPAQEGLAVRFRVTGAGAADESTLESAKKKLITRCENYRYLEGLFPGTRPKLAYPEVYESGRLSARIAAEQVATLERTRLGLGSGPIHNLSDVLEQEAGVNLFIQRLHDVEYDFKVAGLFAFVTDLGPFILVNGSHPAPRQRWTMAHEYGHFLKDRHEGEVTVLVEYERKPFAEQFADAFAACFLMPADGLRQRFRTIVQATGDFVVGDLCQLADQYGVAVESMARRLEALDCVSRGTWDRLRHEHGVDGRTEAATMGIRAMKPEKHRLPARYQRLAVQAYIGELITEGELMRILDVSRVEAREIVDEFQFAIEMDDSGRVFQLDLPLDKGVGVASGEASRD